ncbi:hypothetical protein [Pseudomonas sp. FP818]|uniref:hypothetical protein n=1 Tax=Pseudomonas sp. FP818 TaxID=2954099 RepID=UPI002733095C|nr:hypothetical protein [Pseudomonas sp. FP818]WLI36338.1 hypothetical protein PSH80_08385 [Pseudomonas sp. FP818]
MKKNSNSSTSGGIGILGLLGVLFVGLKLTGYIDWSWWYVTMPFWGGLAVALAVIVLILIGWLLTRLLSTKR